MLFKYVYNAQADKENQDESLVRYCSAFDPNLKLIKARAWIEDSTEKFIIPFLSEDFYEELVTAYQGTPTAQELKAIRKLQRPVAWFALLEALNGSGVTVSTTGPSESVDVDGSYVMPRMWADKKARLHAFKKGHELLEKALAFLEKNKADYPTWASSEAYTQSKELFFNSAAELAPYLVGGNLSRAIYLTLRPAIRLAEKDQLKKILGSAFFTEFKAAVVAGGLSAIQEELLEKIRWALANYLKVITIPSHGLTFSQDGRILQFSHEGSTATDGATRDELASPERLRSSFLQAQRLADKELTELKAWLDQNADSFPTYETTAKEDGAKATRFLKNEDDDGRTYSTIFLG